MKLAGLAALLLLAISAPSANPASPADRKPRADSRDLHHCNLSAVHAADNDIRLDQDRRPKPLPANLPAAVSNRILDHVTDAAKRSFTPEEWHEARQSCDDIFAPVFHVIGPAGLQLYVAPRRFTDGNSVDYFVMYDPRTGAVTESPPLIYTKWSTAFGEADPLIGAPIVHMEPGQGGQPPLLIVEERTHNGSVYDAVVYRYFEIGKDMSLTQILAVEARAILLSDPDEYTERNATFLTPNRVRLDVSSRSSGQYGAQGSVWLERAGSGQPFHVVHRQPARADRSDGLVTYCDSAKRDDDFLRVGCDFYY